jgi:fibro-slime domain-containing protein
MSAQSRHHVKRTAGIAALLAGAAAFPVAAGPEGPGADGPGESGPNVLQLTGVVRDFRERTDPAGHPDFEKKPGPGFAIYSGNVAPMLGEDGKPAWTGGGFKVTTQWKDSMNRPICYLLFDPSKGDVAGTVGVSDSGGVTSADSFDQWFRDVPGMNLSLPLTLTMVKQDNGSFVFDDKLDPYFAGLGGFFPIEGQLFGNPGGTPDRNFHFTFELHTQFMYDAAGDYVFQFIGDDDVWVFINNQLVIDLGGVHSAKSQYVDLDRLGLQHGMVYTLDFFFAERHRTQSNFRIETNLPLEEIELPTTTAAFD